jgi:copper(I)-binding protein
MTMRFIIGAALLLWGIGTSLPARAQITVENAWVRATVGAGKVSAAYATIANSGKEADELIAVRFSGAMMTEIHESQSADGVMKMEAVASLAIPAGSKVELKPGGYHVMVMSLAQPLRVGDKATLVFVFKSQGEVSARADVVPISATGPN